MKLDFTILWVDDQPRHIQSYREQLERKIAPLGFQVEVVHARSVAQITEVVGGHGENHEIDLVLVDYDLGTGSGGEVALEQVRRMFRYKEIIFYSATDVEKLRNLAYERRIDGAHFSTRLELVDETAEVVRKLLAKVLDIHHMRGLVMSAASDIDDLVERSLAAVYEKLADEDKKEFISELQDQLRGKLRKWEGELEKAFARNELSSILKIPAVYSAADRLTSLRKRLEKQAPSAADKNEMVKKYVVDIVPRRNKLAHVKLGKDGGLPDGLSADDMAVLRCDYINHRRNFFDIAVLLDVEF